VAVTSADPLVILAQVAVFVLLPMLLVIVVCWRCGER
jgi:hypothetical protein